MNIKRSTNLPIHSSVPVVEVKQKEGKGHTVVLDLAKLGDVVESGVNAVGGTTSAFLQMPRTLIAPAIATFEPSRRNLMETLVSAAAGSAALGGVGHLLGSFSGNGADKVIGATFGAMVGAIVGGTLGQNLELFDYTAIDQARSEARDLAHGNSARKAGAAFTHGYRAALVESYEDGRTAVSSVGSAIGAGFSFLDGVVRPSK